MATQTFTPGKVYSLFGKNGQTMVEIETAGLKIGQVVSYSDIANPYQKAVVVDECFNGHGQQVIFLEDFHTSRVSKNDLEDSGHAGWHLEPETMTHEQVNAVIAAHAKQEQEEEEARKQARAEREKMMTEGKARFESLRPTWAKAAIVAIYQINDCDYHTDYFATKKGRSVFLAWSKHDKNRFDEMRQAALNFEETKHLGPGCDIYKPVVVFASDGQTGGGYHNKGQVSHWHSELQNDEHGKQIQFPTKEQAQAHIDKTGNPYSIQDGNVLCEFEWDIRFESVEHRERYRGGRGIILGADTYNTGWKVQKHTLDYGLEEMYKIFADPKNIMGLTEPPKTEEMQEPKQNGKIRIRFNSLGIEIEFTGIPSQETRDKMKSAGYRWHGKNKYWYAKRNTQTEAIARTIQ